MMDFTEDLLYFIPKVIGDRKFILLGHSLGGGVAMQLATKMNGRIQKLILMGSIPATGPTPDFKDENGKIKIIKNFSEVFEVKRL
jgi:pimeloyl-ACP methyl ester carboxylesterase